MSSTAFDLLQPGQAKSVYSFNEFCYTCLLRHALYITKKKLLCLTDKRWSWSECWVCLWWERTRSNDNVLATRNRSPKWNEEWSFFFVSVICIDTRGQMKLVAKICHLRNLSWHVKFFWSFCILYLVNKKMKKEINKIENKITRFRFVVLFLHIFFNLLDSYLKQIYLTKMYNKMTKCQ